MNRTRPPGRRD